MAQKKQRLFPCGSEQDVVLENIAFLVTPGEADGEVISQEGTDLWLSQGRVKKTGSGIGLEAPETAQRVDASKWSVFPGLVDVHTHPIFAGSRATETLMKAAGATYQEVYAAGGGIAKSCQATRSATDAELLQLMQSRLEGMQSLGVTAVEIKTGYGLHPEEELRQLHLIWQLNRQNSAMSFISPTYLAPHAASPEFGDLQLYLEALLGQLEQIAELNGNHRSAFFGNLAVDIFIEEGYFSKEQGRVWLEKALALGLDCRIHADEFSDSGGARLAAELAESLQSSGQKKGRILSVDHCQNTPSDVLQQLSQYGVPVVCLPLTSFFSQIPYRSVEPLREAGVGPVIATDFNPGSAPIANLWLACFLALTRAGFTRDEVILGVTSRAAAAMGAADFLGKLSPGFLANWVALPADSGPDDFFSSPLGENILAVGIAGD